MARSKYILGWVLAMGVTSSFALSIGTVRGDVWIEQPLDLVVPIQLDPSSDPGTLCAGAEVAYGDFAVESRSVRVTQEPGAEPGSVRLRIVATTAINDAVVNLTVYAGCEQKVVRRFVLLPDVPPLAAAPAYRAAPLVEAPVAPAEPAPAVAAAPAPAKPTVRRSGGAPAGNAKPAATRSKATPAPQPASVASGAPHLSLGPLVIMERKLVPEQASHAPDPEMIAAQEALQKLRLDYEGLQLQAARTEAEFATLRQHLAKAEADRTAIILWAGGAFAALVLLVAAGLVWWGRRERERWMHAQGFDAEDEEAILSDISPVAADKWVAPQAAELPPEPEPQFMPEPRLPVLTQPQALDSLPSTSPSEMEIDFELPEEFPVTPRR